MLAAEGPRAARKACAVCGATARQDGRPTLLRCSGCKSVLYCSIEHQHKDWSRHAAECAGSDAAGRTPPAVSRAPNALYFLSPPFVCYHPRSLSYPSILSHYLRPLRATREHPRPPRLRCIPGPRPYPALVRPRPLRLHRPLHRPCPLRPRQPFRRRRQPHCRPQPSCPLAVAAPTMISSTASPSSTSSG